MIDKKQAIRNAKDDLIENYEGSDIRDVLLEEVELSDDEKLWKITLGFSSPVSDAASNLTKMQRGLIQAGVLLPKFDRIFKIFLIDSDNGRVKSMKIWNH